MKVAYLVVNGAVLRFPLSDAAVDNFGAWLSKTSSTRRTRFWQEEKVCVWQSPGMAVIVIKNGCLDAYVVKEEGPERPDYQKEALEVLKQAVNPEMPGDEWKKS